MTRTTPSGLASCRCGVPAAVPGLALAALALLGCRSTTPRVQAETLPFHLAVIPFDSAPLPDGPSRAPTERDLDYALLLEGDALARGFTEMLDGLSFTEVTLLEPPADVTPEDFARWPRARQDEHWLAAARGCAADLVLQAEVRADPRATWSRGPEMPGTLGADLFWKVGVAVSQNFWTAAFSAFYAWTAWDNADRSYRFDVGLDGALHELAPLLDPRSDAHLANRRAELMRVFVYDSDADLAFAERSGFLGHAASFVVPGTLLASNDAVEHENLREAIAEYIGKVFVQELEFRKLVLLQGNGLFPFSVERLAIVGAGEGGFALDVEVLLRTETVDAMEGYRLWMDDELVCDAEFGAATPAGDARVRHRLLLPLPRLHPLARIRLEVRDGAARQNVRTFTLRMGRTGHLASKELEMDLPLHGRE